MKSRTKKRQLPKHHPPAAGRQTAGRTRQKTSPRHVHEPRNGKGWMWGVVASIALLGLGYQFTREDPGVGSSGSSSSAQVDQLLREVGAAYRNVNHYRDDTRILLRTRVGDGWAEESATLRVLYQRPNQIRLVVERAGPNIKIELGCDGQSLRSRVTDAGTGDFDNQFVERSAPGVITVGTLYSGTEYADLARPNELFSLLMALPTQLQLSQLGFLLAEEGTSPLDPLLKSARQTKLLTGEAINRHNCQRVEIVADPGRFVFWIDASTRLLRRIEFPAGSPEQQQGGLLTASYAHIDTETSHAANDFTLTASAGAKLVRHFVLPPMDQPAEVLNQQVGPFAFTSLTGDDVSSSRWEGKIAVLCWFDRQPSSQAAVTNLQAVYEKFTNNPKVRMLAVCTEPSTDFSHRDVERLLNRWQITLPAARDLRAVGRDAFKIPAIPCLVVIDSKGVVQLHEVGVDAQLDEHLPMVIEKLLEGEELAGDYLEFIATRQKTYQQHLAAASLDAPATMLELSPAEIAAKSEPQRIKFTALWANDELQEPGNLLAVLMPDNGIATYVVDGVENVAELDSGGRLVAKHSITNAEQGAIRKLQTAVDENGQRYFVGWSNLSQQLRVFDETWKTAFVYPPAGQEHAGIQAAHLADLNGDGALELYVGFADALGTHQVDLAGQRTWSNRDATPVLSLTSSPDRSGKSFLMVTSAAGQILPIDNRGESQRPLNVGSRAIHHLVASDTSSSEGVFCGVSYLPTGNLLTVGLDGKLSERWSYALPPGVYRNQIQFVTSLNWNHAPHWILAAADGSIHIVSHDGEFHDHFNYGEELTGLATYATHRVSVLLVASKGGVKAFEMAKP